MNFIERWLISVFGSVDNVFLSFFTKIGPYLTAAIPAILAGYGMHQQFDGTVIGLVIGIVVGVGFEAASIKIIHTVIVYYDRSKRIDTKFVLLILAALLVVTLISITIFTADKAYPWIVRMIGGSSPTLAALAYMAIGIERGLDQESKLDKAKEKLDLELFEEMERARIKEERAARSLASQIEAERQKLALQSEKLKLEAEARAYEAELKRKDEAERQRIELEAQIELEKLSQKHEKAMKKLETQADSPTVTSSAKPFRRYDEFAQCYAQTQDLSEISTRMGVKIGTIRGYKRKFDRYNADLASDALSDENVQDTLENEQIELNGHV